MKRYRSFLARLRNRHTAKPQANRTARRLQKNFESLENRQLLATMAGLEMAPAEVTDQDQIVVNTTSQVLADRDLQQASEQRADTAIPDTLADRLAPAFDINRVNLNSQHLDQLLSSPNLQENLTPLGQGLEMQPDFSSMDGLAEEIQADLDQFDGIVESMILWNGRWWYGDDGSTNYWDHDGDSNAYRDQSVDMTGSHWSAAGSWDDNQGTWSFATNEDGGTLLSFIRDFDGKIAFLEFRPGNNDSSEEENKTQENQNDDREEESWLSEAWGWVFDDDDDNDDNNESDDDDDSWATDLFEWLTGEDDENGDDDSDDCFPKPWWDEYGFNSISDIAGTELLLSNPLQTQDVAEFFLSQGDGQFLQAMDMIHTENLWQM